MSVLGVDVGTTGCKAAAFSEEGHLLAYAYDEYNINRPHPMWAQLNVQEVWDRIRGALRLVASNTKNDPIRALSVSSLGEAVVPVTADRKILGPSILNEDARGGEFLPSLKAALDDYYLHSVNGNTLGNQYGLTKLLWLRKHRPEVYERTYKFLFWGSFVAYMLGVDPVVDFSLANRSLLFDINTQTWSDELLKCTGLDSAKLPDICRSGVAIGNISREAAQDLGLPPDVMLVSGAHDQCASAVGSGATQEGRAMLGMGTYLCLTPVYRTRPDPAKLVPRGLNTEHHAVPRLFVSFIYNQGGNLLKWYRDTFAATDYVAAKQEGMDIYERLLSEMPDRPSGVIALPHFMTTGPPDFVSDSAGVLAGLRLTTSRGDIVKGILEGSLFYLRECLEALSGTGIEVHDVRVTGGGSRSDQWVQMTADILCRSLVRPKLAEAGSLGAAILAGVGLGVYGSVEEGVQATVRFDRQYDPTPEARQRYHERFEHYCALWPLMRDYLRTMSRWPG